MSLSGFRYGVTNVLSTLAKAPPPPVGAQKNPPNTLEYLQAASGGTFGRTDIGASWNVAWNSQSALNPVTLTEAGSVSKMTAYLRNTDAGNALCHFRAALYADSAGQPGALVAVGDSTTIAAGMAAQWVDLTFPTPPTLPAGSYWLGFFGDATANGLAIAYSADAVKGPLRFRAVNAGDFASPPNPYSGSLAGTTFWMSIYATLTTAGASTVYPATGQVDSSTAASGTATVKRAATGTTAAVTGASAAALAKHFATGSASVVTTLSGAAFRRYSATGTVAAVTGSSATPTTKRASTGSAAAATGINGTAAAKHPVTGLAGAVTTGTSGVVTVKRRTSGTPSINVVTVLSGAATVTEAPTGNYATGQVDAVTGLSGRANVTRAASGAVTSSTTVSGAALARHGVTGNVSSASSLSGSVSLLVAVTGNVDVVTGISGTPRSEAVTYPASGRINVVTTICDATVYAAAGLISAGSSRGMGTPGHRSGFTSTGGRGIAATALGRSLTSEGHERTTP